MRTLLTRVAIAALVVPSSIVLLGGPASASHSTATYRVTITNLTTSQPLSPPVVATHRPWVTLFRVGRPASDELAAIAQAGDQVPLATALADNRRVTDVVDVGRPLTRSGTTTGGFSDTADLQITGAPGDRLSLATMLICTNDGFTGLDRIRLPRHGSAAQVLVAYDAGREDNTERSGDLVDPCSALGPVELAGDPNGNDDVGPATEPRGRIAPHRGISGAADLDRAEHGWQEPVAVVTVTRVG
ncbi:MAG: spondin domain-containing protein [Natronosporangium sp.]